MGELFQMVASHFQSHTQYQKFAKQCQKEYDVKIYNLPKFTISYARSVYNDLDLKYREKTLRPNPNGWYQNERRLYVWFILCFMQVKMLEPNKFVDSYEKYWRSVSEAMWDKEVYFLKYQLLNLIKAKGRTVWHQNEDTLLRKVVAKFPPKQWNQIAKQFYHLSGGEFFKTPKQCRQRWQNHLNSSIRKGTWSVEEDLAIFKYVAESHRKSWAKIVPILDYSRTEHMIKNRFKSLTTKFMLEKSISQQQAITTILKNLERKQEIGIQEEEVSQIIEGEEQQQPTVNAPKQEEQTVRTSVQQQHQQHFDYLHSRFHSSREYGEIKMVNGMESNMMPSFMGMGRPILMDESMRSNPSLCNSIHILINNSNHFYSSMNSNFFPPKEEHQERIFFENDSFRVNRNADRAHNAYNNEP